MPRVVHRCASLYKDSLGAPSSNKDIQLAFFPHFSSTSIPENPLDNQNITNRI
jgi:hypothetical protein